VNQRRVVERRQHAACVGQTVTLRCHPPDKKDVDWHRTTTTGHNRIYSNGRMYEDFRGRFTVVKSGRGGYDLVIGNVSVADTGRYVCVEDKGIGDRHVVELNVTGKLSNHHLLTIPRFWPYSLKLYLGYYPGPGNQYRLF